MFCNTDVCITVYSLPPPTKKPSLIVGDSLFRYVGNSLEVEVRCFPGIRIKQLAHQLQIMKMQNEKFETIIIPAGTNNIKGCGSPRILASEVKDLIEEGKKLFPSANWVISGIIHRRDVDVQFVIAINQGLVKTCNDLSVKFVDANICIGNNDLGKDGLHVNKAGSLKLEKFLHDVNSEQKCQGN